MKDKEWKIKQKVLIFDKFGFFKSMKEGLYRFWE